MRPSERLQTLKQVFFLYQSVRFVAQQYDQWIAKSSLSNRQDQLFRVSRIAFALNLTGYSFSR
jgi:hypothetical protein